MSNRNRSDSIVVSVPELLEQLEYMRDDGMAFVELSIAPPDIEEGAPARLDLSAVGLEKGAALVDYDSIDAADIDPDTLGQYLD